MDSQLQFRVVPHARKSEVVGLMDDGKTWKIRLAALPVDGRANEELIRWLANVLELPRRNLELVAGETSRTKRVWIRGLALEKVTAELRELCRRS